MDRRGISYREGRLLVTIGAMYELGIEEPFRWSDIVTFSEELDYIIDAASELSRNIQREEV